MANAIHQDDTSLPRWKFAYVSTLCEGLQQQLSANQFTDTRVTVGDKTFDCHRIILAAMSPFFEAMYLSGMQESQAGAVNLQDVGSDTFQSILNFIYRGEDVVNTENVDDILRAASMLQIQCLAEVCEFFMTQHVDGENCVATWKLASTHDCPYLANKAWSYIMLYFTDVLDTEDFLNLDIDDVLAIIKNNDLTTPNEETVCEAVLSWINHDKDNRQQYTDKLFEHLRLPLMNPEYLLEAVDCNPLVRENEKCKEYIDEAKRYHLLQARRHEFVSARLIHRNQGEYEEVIIFIGGNVHPERTTEEVWSYGIKRKEWMQLAYLPCSLGMEFAVCSHGNAVFVSGGSEMMNGMMYFLTTHNMWLACERMLIGRRRHCMVAVGDYLFVLGGFDDEESEERFSTLMSVERFSVLSGTWEDTGYLTVPVRTASASVVQDKIYIFGGIDGEGQNLSTVQCFDTRSRTCTLVQDLPSLSGMSSSVMCNRTTFLIFPNGSVLKMEATGEMEHIGTIPDFERCGYGVVQHEGKIIIIGGIDSLEIYDNFIIFDPNERESSVAPSDQLLRPLFGFGCAKATVSRSFFR